MRVVVLGAGYAGLVAARRLERALPPDVSLTVVDERPHHLVQHEIHRVVRRPALADHLRIPLRDVLRRADLRTERVESVDPAAGTASLAGGDLDYDYGLVCLGARTAFYDLPGVEAHATPLKRLDHAREIRSAFLDAVASGGPAARAVVGGAGLSGVQVAGELAALADERGASAEVLLLEQRDAVAPQLPPAFGRAVREELADRGVRVRTGAAVAGADGEAVELTGGERVPYDQFVWTGGIRGPAALGEERPVVRADLRVTERTFAVGDAASVVDANGERVPASAQAAIREARVAADNVAALATHDAEGGRGFEPRLDEFRFDSPGWAVSVGDGAVAQVGPAVVRGRAARAAKATAAASYLGSVGAARRAVAVVEDAFR